MQKKLIVSGHQGYIGSNFCKTLKRKKIKFIKFDFKKKQKNLNSFTHFFHFSFDINIKRKSFERNKKRLLKVLHVCSANNIKLIFPSTCTYKYNKKNKRNSKSILPLNKYSKSKIQCEKMILQFSKKFELSFFIFRVFNVYGVKTINRGVVANLINRFKKEKTVNLKYSENVRDFINLEDLTRLFLKSILVKKSGIFEAGSGRTISIKKLAISIKKVLKFNSNLFFIKPYKSKKNNFSKSNILRTKSIFSWSPKVNLINGLRKLNLK